MILLTIVIFVLVLGLLVLAHEFGHFIAAKKAGMRVDEFGFGFPPKLFSWRRGETLFSFNLLPLGGFVKIYGEDGEHSLENRSFGSKSAWRRFTVLISGVGMNLVLAWVLLSIGLLVGVPQVVSQDQVLPKSAHIRNVAIGIIEVAPDSPAQMAGIKSGDKILFINGQAIDSIAQMQNLTKENAGKETKYQISRGDTKIEKTITPRANPPEGEGALGVALGQIGLVSYPWYEVLYRGLISTINIFLFTITAIWGLFAKLFTGQSVGAAVAGPIGIAVLTRDMAQLGISYLIQFVAVLSVNLAIINAIPFPALDGGRVLFLVIEKIRRKKLPQNAEQIANGIGFFLLISLMIAVTVKDVTKFSDSFLRLFERVKDIF
jgi:regulator of sigma E protease